MNPLKYTHGFSSSRGIINHSAIIICLNVSVIIVLIWKLVSFSC